MQLSVSDISKKIYVINGIEVMLDSDLAILFGVETKRINEAVKNNPKKFPLRFSWKLTDDECKNFLVENFDQKKIEKRGGKYKNPRVFTEQGVSMLTTILKSKIAIETSIRIMDAFVLMRHYISNNLLEQKYINNLVITHENRLNLVEETLLSFNNEKDRNDIYFNGQIYDAYSKITDICNSAKESLIIVDNYADNKILDIVKRLNINVLIITKPNQYLTNQDIIIYNEQYHNLKVKYTNNYHDRYFIIDEKVLYHCGASINRIGYKTFSINEINDEKYIRMLLSDINNIKN